MEYVKDTHSPLALLSVRSIGIIELTRMGDVLTTIPSIQILRARYPGAEMHIIIDARYAKFMQRVFPFAVIHRLGRQARTVSMVRLVKEIRRSKLDLVCSMSPSRTNAMVTLASGARLMVGYLGATRSLTPYLDSTTVTMRGFKRKRRITFHKESISARPRKILEALGIPEQTSAPVNFFWSTRSSLIPRSTPYVVIHPFSRWQFREWPLERFEKLAREIVSSMAIDVVFVCDSKESERLAGLRNNARAERRIRFIAAHDISEAADVIAGASLFIGNDSGPVHLASLLQVPLVGVYGPADPVFTAPTSPEGTFLYKRVSCSPCRQHSCTRPDQSCMTLISVAEVVRSVAARLQYPSRVVAHA